MQLDLSKFNNSLEQRGKTLTTKLQGTSALCFGKYHATEKLDKEKHDEYEKRTWREKLHYDTDGNVFIPQFALKNMISASAAYLGKKIEGKGRHTYTKHFEGGIIVPENSYIINGTSEMVQKDNVHGDWRMVPSDGKKGGTTRVEKCFPQIHPWKIEAKFVIIDNIITPEIFAEHLIEAGWYIGLMSFRPRNGGINGRFVVDSIDVDRR